MMLRRVRERVNKTLEWVLIVLFTFSIVNVLYQVFTRFVLRQASPYTEELARFLLIWIGLLGSSYTAGRKMHLAIDIFLRQLTGRGKVWAQTLIHVLIILFTLTVMVGGGSQLVLLTLRLGQVSSALHLKMGYVYLALPLSGFLIAFFSSVILIEEYQSMRAEAKKKEPELKIFVREK